MKRVTGTLEQLLQLRDEDSALHGYPNGPCLRRCDVVICDGVYAYPLDEDLLSIADNLTADSRALLSAVVDVGDDADERVVRREGEEQ